MGIACPPGRNSGDGKRKGQRDVHRITVCAETHLAAREAVHVLKGGIIARLPCSPDTERSLANVDIAGTIASVSIAAMDAVSTDEAIQARFDRFHGVTGFNQNPHLEHVAGFSIVAGGLKARCNDDPQGVLMKEKAVQREPPTINSAKQ